MTDDERKMLTELHAYLMSPRAPGKKSRAEDLDDALTSIRAGKMIGRAALWSAGFIIAIGGAIKQLWPGGP